MSRGKFIVNVAREIGQMVSYAFLQHRDQSDPGCVPAVPAGTTDNISAVLAVAGEPSVVPRNLIRREAFVEWLLEYLLKTEGGAKVLLKAASENAAGIDVDGFELAVHTRQYRSGDSIPDFEVRYARNDAILTLLVELKVGALLNPGQEQRYPDLRADRDTPRDQVHLISLSPQWQPVSFKREGELPGMGKFGTVQSLTFADLSRASRQAGDHAVGNQPELWEFLEATAEGMRSATAPLHQASVLDDRDVVREMEEWLQLFEAMARSLEIETWGFSTRNRFATPYEAGVEKNVWGLDFGECGYWDDTDTYKRSPIWYSKRGNDSWSVLPARLGLGQESLAAVEMSMTSLSAERFKQTPDVPSGFVGAGSSQRFEFARQIMWSAMHTVATMARDLDWRAKPTEDHLGLAFFKIGREDVVARIATRDDAESLRLRFIIDDLAVEPEESQRGQDYIGAVAVRFAALLRPSQFE